jgi:hypothetical protein
MYGIGISKYGHDRSAWNKLFVRPIVNIKRRKIKRYSYIGVLVKRYHDDDYIVIVE